MIISSLFLQDFHKCISQFAPFEPLGYLVLLLVDVLHIHSENLGKFIGKHSETERSTVLIHKTSDVLECNKKLEQVSLRKVAVPVQSSLDWRG